jgi:hypothetical protein
MALMVRYVTFLLIKRSFWIGKNPVEEGLFSSRTETVKDSEADVAFHPLQRGKRLLKRTKTLAR